MSKSVNKVILIGNLTRDPDIRYLPNGNAVCSLTLATNEGYKDKNTGQSVDRAEFHRVEAFGKLAEIIGQYLKKGSKVYFEGKLRTDEYEKDGIKRYTTKIIANEMQMLGSASDQQGQYQGAPQQMPQQAPQQQAPYGNQQPAYGQQPSQQAPVQQGGYGQPQGQPAAQPQQAPQSAPQQAPYVQPQQAPQQQGQPQPQPSNAFEDFDDDIPF